MEQEIQRHYFTGNGAPYHEAEKKLGERTGNLYREKAWWQLVTAVLAGIVLVMSVVAVLLMRKLEPRPVIKYVYHNEHGQFRIGDWSEYSLTDAALRNQLILWLRCVRAIPTDREALRWCWKHVPTKLLKKTQAFQVVAAYQKQLKPDEHLFNKSVVIHDLDGFPRPDGRWELWWREETYALNHGQMGQLESVTDWNAVLLISRHAPPADAAETNPDGIWITELSWGPTAKKER